MKFIFTVLDTGCLVTQMGRYRILAREFCATPRDFRATKLYEKLKKYKSSPIHIFFDTQDQRYERACLKETPWYHLKKLLRHKTEAQNGRTECHAYSKVAERTYQFSHVNLSEKMVGWLHFIESLGHPIRDVRLLPIEMQGFFEHVVSKTQKIQEPCIIFCYYDKNLGLRQNVLYKGTFHVTRLVPLPGKDLPQEVRDETDALVSYLSSEGKIPASDIRIVTLRDLEVFSKLDPQKHTVFTGYVPGMTEKKSLERWENPLVPRDTIVPLKYYNTHWDYVDISTISNKLSVGPLSILGVLLSHLTPVMPLKPKVLSRYYTHRLWRKIFFGASIVFFAIFAFFKNLDEYPWEHEEQRKKIVELRKKNYALRGELQSLALQTEEMMVVQRYERLQARVRNPFDLLEEVSPWLAEHWSLRHFEWTYISPKFKEDASVLDRNTKEYETLDLWLKYMGPRHLRDRARAAQVRVPLKSGVQAQKKTYQGEFDVLRIERGRT